MTEQVIRKIRFSIRSKLLFLVLSLLLISFAVYLLISIDLFRKDKKAYIFEVQTAFAQTTANMYESEFVKLIRDMQFIYNLHVSGSTIKDLKLSSNLYQVANWPDGQDLEMLLPIKEENEISTDVASDIIQKMGDQLIEVVFHTPTQGKAILALRNKASGNILFALFEASHLLDQVQDQSFGAAFILNQQNKNIISSKEHEIYKNSILASMSLPGKTGAKEEEFGGESTLLSYKRFFQDKFTLVIATPTSKTYEIANFLIRKTGVLAVFIFSLSALVIILVSSKLTVPLANLIQTITQISEGDYDTRVQVTARDEIGVMADHFNNMSGKISDYVEQLKIANAQLEDYNRNLEQKVRERTEELFKANQFLDAMVNSLDQGLFVFDPKNKINSKTTKVCEELFGGPIGGKNVFDVFKVPPSEREVMNDWSEIMFTGVVPFENAVELGINELERGADPKANDYKFIKLDYYPMLGKQKELQNVVVVATDKTEEKRLKLEQQEKESLAGLILNIAKSKKQFIAYARRSLDKLETALKLLKKSPKEYSQTKIIIHSLRGSAGIFGLMSISKKLFDIEEQILFLEKENRSMENLVLQVEEVYNEFNATMDGTAKDVLGKNPLDTSPSDEDRIIQEYRELLLATGNEHLIKEFDEAFIKVPVKEFYFGVQENLQQLALGLGKELKTVAFQGLDVKIEANKVGPFFENLIHVFRNAVYHGIETPSERTAAGKPSAGSIQVRNKLVQVEGRSFLQVEVIDDGRGIDFKKLGIDKSQINKIFDAGVSSAGGHNTVAGLGVGLATIAEILTHSKGHFKIDTAEGKGCHFTFQVPV